MARRKCWNGTPTQLYFPKSFHESMRESIAWARAEDAREAAAKAEQVKQARTIAEPLDGGCLLYRLPASA
jgi:hypothetical protein